VIAGVLFLIGVVLLWRQQSEAGDEAVEDHERGQRFLPVAGMVFAVVFAAEFGDLTQIFTVSLAARYATRSRSGSARCWPCGYPGSVAGHCAFVAALPDGTGRASLDMRAADLGRWEPRRRPRS
jgi:hypothetical protein